MTIQTYIIPCRNTTNTLQILIVYRIIKTPTLRYISQDHPLTYTGGIRGFSLACFSSQREYSHLTSISRWSTNRPLSTGWIVGEWINRNLHCPKTTTNWLFKYIAESLRMPIGTLHEISYMRVTDQWLGKAWVMWQDSLPITYILYHTNIHITIKHYIDNSHAFVHVYCKWRHQRMETNWKEITRRDWLTDWECHSSFMK